MRFSKEIIDQKLQQVPENIRTAVTSAEVSQMLIDIGKERGLHIDQIGILEEETLYAMLGLQTSEQFVKNLQDNMRVSQSTALGLAQDINSQILASVRSTAQKEEENISREDVLSGIENPTPTVPPISNVDHTVAGPAVQREIVSEPRTESQPEKTSDNVAQDFISGKLTETVNLPSKQATMTPEQLTSKPATKPLQKPISKTDPYREPLA